ncbi:MAG: endopeptidase La, partial [Nitrospirae bacterium]|nr:endopeptidase La [Nitrospirota bacterium]
VPCVYQFRHSGTGYSNIIYIESTTMKGKGILTLTGQLGDVMKESAQTALSYIRSRSSDLNINEAVFSKSDIHIHIPAGAIPKDGPSAGITMTTALASTLTGVPVNKNIAMTGEVTLRGNVLPIGGLKEKILAAKRMGIKILIIPKRNKKDLDEIPKYIKKDTEFFLVEDMLEVLKIALKHPEKPKTAKRSSSKNNDTVSANPVL